MPGYRNVVSTRQAQVRDHDELVHIIARSQLRCPALAQVPTQAGAAAEYALARLIKQQGPCDKVLVAHSNDNLQGCMAVTTDINIEPLQQHFDLHVYDQLLQPDVYEGRLAAHRSILGKDCIEQGASIASPGLVRAILQGMAPPDAVPNAFAMTMLCCDSEAQQKAVALTLLSAAFDAFPDKDYCLLTLPPDAPEVPLLATFTRLLPPPGSALVDVLYLCHRFALLQDFQVQAASKPHVPGVRELLAGTANQDETQTAFTTAMESGTAYIAVCQGQVVGLATYQPMRDISHLQHAFLLAQMPELQQQHAKEGHILQIQLFSLNPIFAHRAEQMLVEILNLAKGQALVYLLSADEPAPDVMSSFRQIPPRHLLLPEPHKQPQHALHAFSTSMPHRRPINTHIVVVGASDCGLSVVESLLFNTSLRFNAITLVSPGGILQGNVYSKSLLNSLALQASVTIVDVEVVSIDRTQQLITLSNSQKVLYGMLVITAGLVQTMPSEDIMLQLQISGSNVVSLKDADSMPTQEGQPSTSAGPHPGTQQLVVLTSKHNAVPASIQRAIAQAGLVCDGRTVVDAAFRTNDLRILAAGTIAKFSRRYGHNLCHSMYNSFEIGQRAGDSIAATFSSPFVNDSTLPQLRCGRLTTTAVPGGGTFACAIAAGYVHEQAKAHRALVSRSSTQYCCLRIDDTDTIQSVAVCSAQGQAQPPSALLLPLAGLPITFFHDLLQQSEPNKAETSTQQRAEASEAEDVGQKLTQPWTGLLYHDQFPQLRDALVQGLVGDGGLLQGLHGVSEAAVMHVQNDVIDFVQQQQQGASELEQYDVSVVTK